MKVLSNNFAKFLILITFLQSFLSSECVMPIKKDWDYRFISTELINDTPDATQAFVELSRISRGKYGLSGNVTLFTGTFGENGFIEMSMYRSVRNDGDFLKLPYEIQKESFFKFMNDHYKTILMDSLKDCSNMPIVEGVYATDWKAGESLTFTNCVFQDNKDTPAHFQPGFYKIIGRVFRPDDIQMTLTVVAEVFTVH
ncbi:uncharacterized protein LOC129619162 [Condylostylus longicornis]|uniref:uncharacterized protein LOC129619162 n=1 Tax=Condylostylus longicornis TaxID=2530218 RepID=UPI00244DC277|nr:uncharacterized protein LOC129619162 [Condylostylus longicornis]